MMVSLSTLIHLALHALVPLLVAWVFFRSRWRKAWLIMLATMLVDLDHLLADPLFDPNRCSIGFHPLHSYTAITFYLLMSLWQPTRLVGLGLLIHMLVDASDCWRMAGFPLP
ncbi:DUF6122 family protein [Halopseudomonas phragmitis]|uniref:Transmembrane protein n=2 Tax=Pseudomonadaceae TaxID=135621 RepID=A0A1V0B5G0_9GAMM|nr:MULTISPECIES: DUF6122 family protein [Pseudomonadaceae]AQZ95169.1 hypothetical protein BVH74_10600 [Halopseudomonas phragmitis]RHW22009.1 hypothetical protein C2846_05995 [Pseudomonas jilinensis]